MNKKGDINIFLMFIITMFMVLIVFITTEAIFLNHINSYLHTVKLDMFMINKSACLALNRNYENQELSSINKDEYLKYFRNVLTQNYDLDNNLRNGTKLINKIDILEYEYLNDEKTNEPKISATIGVKIEPLVFKELLEDKFYFRIHEDVFLKRLKR